MPNKNTAQKNGLNVSRETLTTRQISIISDCLVARKIEAEKDKDAKYVKELRELLVITLLSPSIEYINITNITTT